MAAEASGLELTSITGGGMIDSACGEGIPFRGIYIDESSDGGLSDRPVTFRHVSSRTSFNSNGGHHTNRSQQQQPHQHYNNGFLAKDLKSGGGGEGEGEAKRVNFKKRRIEER